MTTKPNTPVGFVPFTLSDATHVQTRAGRGHMIPAVEIGNAISTFLANGSPQQDVAHPVFSPAQIASAFRVYLRENQNPCKVKTISVKTGRLLERKDKETGEVKLVDEREIVTTYLERI